MSGSLDMSRGRNRSKPADPAAVLAAAESAPKLFDFGGYFPALQLMREKGYSWRQLGEWVRGFNVEISHVHLRRLYVQESGRSGQKKSGRATMPARKRPAPARPPAAPIQSRLVAKPVMASDDHQQEDLLRYEGLS